MLYKSIAVTQNKMRILVSPATILFLILRLIFALIFII